MFHDDGQARFYQGDVRDVLRTLDAESVNCVVTSPPYWGLRDYGVSGQLGLEPTPEEYVANMVEVFREMRRVLRPDGTLWLNIGDSYARDVAKGGSGPNGKHDFIPAYGSARHIMSESKGSSDGMVGRGDRAPVRVSGGNLKPKDLVGIPWMLAFALRADGWWLRQDIIWAKPNPMPESVTDRCTKAHETIFLLTKSPRYFFDADAIREGVSEAGVVEATNLDSQSLVLSQDFRAEKATADHSLPTVLVVGENGRGVLQSGVRAAAAILDGTKRENQLGLARLDSQVGHERLGDNTGAGAVRDPIVRRATAQATRFANGDISAKEFLGELDSLCVTLPDGHYLKELRAHTGPPAATPVPLIHPNGNAPVAVNDAGKVGQFEFGHHQKYTVEVTPSYARANGRNKRSVWTIATEAYPEAHFATFPQALVRPCVLAGCPEGGTVLDPFLGSGTTALVAKSLGRRAIGIDLSPEYLDLAVKRTAQMGLVAL